jgi:hypothetical protein
MFDHFRSDDYIYHCLGAHCRILYHFRRLGNICSRHANDLRFTESCEFGQGIMGHHPVSNGCALLYSGGLSALQNTAILAALPFSVVVIFMLVSLYKSLSQERKEIKQAEKFQKPRSPRVKKA